MEKKKRFIILSILVLFIIGGGLFYYFSKEDTKKSKDLTYTKYLTNNDYLVANDKNEFLYTKATKDISFQVVAEEGQLDYSIVDENNEKVITKNSLKDGIYTIVSPEGGYEKGKTYTLTINNGVFLDEKLFNQKSVKFIIEKDYINRQVVKDEIIKLSKKAKINTKDNSIILDANEKLKVNDIIEIPGNNTAAYYKVISVEKGKYVVEIPKLEEVFKELDIYETTEIDLFDVIDEAELVEEMEIALANSIDDLLIPGVSADENDPFKVSATRNAKDPHIIDFLITFNLNPNNASFLGVKQHKFTVNVKFSYGLWIDKEINFKRIKILLNSKMVSDIAFKVDLLDKNTNKYLKTGAENFEALIDKALYTALNNDTKKDKVADDANLGKYVFPLPYGFTCNALINLDLEAELKAVLNIGAKTESNMTSGIIFEDWKLTPVSSHNDKASAYTGMTGTFNFGVGGSVEAEFTWLDFVALGVKLGSGYYIDTKAELKVETSEDLKSTFTASATGEYGLELYSALTARVYKIDGSWKFFDKKIPFETFKYPIIKPSSIHLSQTNITIEKGKFVLFDGYALPLDAVDRDITWTSSNDGIVKYYNYGFFDFLYAQKVGETVLTAKTKNGITATCTIKVVETKEVSGEVTEKETKTDTTPKPETKTETKTETTPKTENKTETNPKPSTESAEKPTMTKQEAISKLKAFLKSDAGSSYNGNCDEFECDGNICASGECGGGYGSVTLYSVKYDFDNMLFINTENHMEYGKIVFTYNIAKNTISKKDNVNWDGIYQKCVDATNPDSENYRGSDSNLEECLDVDNYRVNYSANSIKNHLNNLYKNSGVTLIDLIQ